MDQRIGNRAVDGVENLVVEHGGLEREVEDLDFRHAGSGRQAEGFRRELVRPDDFRELRDEEVPHPPRGSGVGVDAALGNGFPEGGLWREEIQILNFELWILNDEEGDELEVIEAGDGVHEGGGFSGSEKAVDVALFLHVDHRADGLA